MSDRPLILLVEDEREMRRFLRTALEAHDYRLLEADTAASGLRLAAEQPPDVILLDLGLPDGDGLDVTEQLRGWSQVPIIVISARGQESDKVAALDLGADDYLTKPFGTAELLARIRVALRRAARSDDDAETPVIEIGNIHIDLVRREVTVDGTLVHLTPIEYRLLTTLARSPDCVMTHRQLLKEVWGPGHADDTHTLRVHMANLRRKIEAEPARPRHLTTEPGVGYRLRTGPHPDA
ncbi:MAG: response regulator [Planctomycetota bacterium]